MSHAAYPLLEGIDNPQQLRLLDANELLQLRDELRQFLISTVCKTGGHFAAGLGAVELTVALHYVFNTPDDKIVWDVGHQCYPHKILTGRRHLMDSIRQTGGMAGFPKITESPYDAFGVGHAGTSISAALGMAIAAKQLNLKHKAIAVIGDGALTAGLAYEALNHAGDLGIDLLVILNDNDMAISPNVGGISNYLARVLSGRLYSTVREGSKKALANMPSVWELARRTEEHVKGMIIPGTLFEEMGFNYIGPIDGHDLPVLVKTLDNISQLSGPQFLHVVTKKGKGLKIAEDNPCAFHAIPPTDPATMEPLNKGVKKAQTYAEVFGDWVCDMATVDSRLIAITPAMREGSALVKFSEQFPERYIDVGIAEQHSVTLAAGMASQNLKPVVAIYSTFLQRAYDQLIHDVAIQNLPVLFAVDRAGLVGGDGPTHAGCFDYSFLRPIPNMVIMAPSNENECRQMLYTGFKLDQPCVVRYPRGAGPGIKPEQKMTAITIGTAELSRQGKDIAILAFGSMVTPALEAAASMDATVINMRFVKPLDAEMICSAATKYKLIITIEENVILGGAGSAVNELLYAHGYSIPVINLGLPDSFIDHGDHQQQLAECGLDSAGIIRVIKEFYSHNTEYASA